MKTISRRDVLRFAAAGAALPACRLLAAQDDAWGGLKFGIMSYTFISFDPERCFRTYKELGISYAEVYADQHLPLTADPAEIGKYKAQLDKHGIQVLSMWADFSADHEANKARFEFARAIGAKVLVGGPPAEAFDSLDKLVQEYDVKVGVHNHGPGDTYDRIADVAKAIEKRHAGIGACVDTGHFIRSGEDPVKAIKSLSPRVYGVHLKDAVDAETYTILGEGKLDVASTLRTLREVKFEGCVALEYELNPEDPVEDVKACLKAVREAVKKL
jgi:sugar phosphate isomerase/epimerase